jgi:hypothetical protein
MGVFDYFNPAPMIGCARPGCTGLLSGWQGKHRVHGMFVWRQGRIDPEDQQASEVCRLDPENLAQQRLRPEDTIPAIYGKCDRCGAYAPFSIECITDSTGLWRETKIVGRVAQSRLFVDNWIQCLNCFDSWPSVEGKSVYICPTCKHIIQVAARNPGGDVISIRNTGY